MTLLSLYPMELAATIASVFRDVVVADGWKIDPAGWEHNSFSAMRAIAGRQSEASKLPRLVSEHKIHI